MVHGSDGALAKADGRQAAISRTVDNVGDEVFSRRMQLLTFVFFGAACWLPIIGLAYLFF